MTKKNKNTPISKNEEIINKEIVGNKLKRLWHNFRRRKVAIIGLIITITFILLAIFASTLSPYDPLTISLSERLQGPSRDHLLGTDEMGRDILSRLLYGVRISIRVGVTVVGLAMLLGVPLGIISGYFGGIVDNVLMRFLDILMAFPGVILSICIVAVLGPSLKNAMIAISIYAMPNFARLARAETLSIKYNEYIEAAKAVGSSNTRIMYSQILPNVITSLIVLGTLSSGNAILTTSSLGFLGLGAQPPTPEWGAMLSAGRKYILMAPHVTIFPGLAILLFVLGLNLFGDGIRDMLDPKLKE